jgi:hypothetical protein
MKMCVCVCVCIYIYIPIYIYIYIFIIMSPLIIFGMRNIPYKSFRENQNTHFVFNFYFCFENNVVYELMWKNIVHPDRPHLTA